MTTTRVPRWAGAVAGFLSAATGVALGTLLAAALTGVPSPVESVGNRAIDYAPPFLKDFAVDQFGTADKPILIGGVITVLAIVAAVAGAIATRRRRLGLGIIVALGLIAVAAALFDRTSTANIAVTALPTIVTLVVAVGSLHLLLDRLAVAGATSSGGFDRRAFLIGAFGLAVVAAVGGGLSRLLGGAAATESRAGIRLPSAAKPAAAVPAGSQVELEGISPYLTPNKDFYRIDTALRVPDVPAEDWSLRIHGMVDEELTFSYRDITEMPLEEHRVTLTCVSNEVGGPYVGNATWLGIPVRTLLEQAGVQDGADAVKSTSADGWTAGTPLDVLTDDRNALLAIGMNGEPLPLIHGFPARLVTPGLYGYVSATKWLTELEVTRFADFQAYWTPRGYDAEAPIKFSSRIDVPRSFGEMPADNARIGGVAWAQTVGIDRVEVKIDDEPWTDAELGAEDGLETWRQWSYTWENASTGIHQVTVRATNRDGDTQTSDRARIRPNGTTGWHSVQFRVA